jgi:hypothetical protein
MGSRESKTDVQGIGCPLDFNEAVFLVQKAVFAAFCAKIPDLSAQPWQVQFYSPQGQGAVKWMRMSADFSPISPAAVTRVPWSGNGPKAELTGQFTAAKPAEEMQNTLR